MSPPPFSFLAHGFFLHQWTLFFFFKTWPVDFPLFFLLGSVLPSAFFLLLILFFATAGL